VFRSGPDAGDPRSYDDYYKNRPDTKRHERKIPMQSIPVYRSYRSPFLKKENIFLLWRNPGWLITFLHFAQFFKKM
jgi:hypothetical protein